MTDTFSLDRLRNPIVQAPMAGGPSTPELALAVCRAGGLGFLAAGYKQAEAVAEEIAAVRAATDEPFGVNLFVPTPAPADPAAVARFAERIAGEASARDVSLGEARLEDDDWDRKLALMAEVRPAVVSFTFGCPPETVISRLQEVGISVWVTAGRVSEAVGARDAGADAVVVQGTEAGGHRGGFVDDEHAGGSGLLALLRLVARSVSLPLVATGGIADGAAVAAVLCAGAAAAQIGTALMLAPEAGTNPAQRALLRDPIPTALTRAFTGRLARGMVNAFLREHSEHAPVAYPEVHHLTSPCGRRRAGAATPTGSTCGRVRRMSWRRSAQRPRSSSAWPPRPGRR